MNIYIQRDSPGGDKESNWLPIPPLFDSLHRRDRKGVGLNHEMILLGSIDTLGGYVKAQREYAAEPRDDTKVRQFRPPTTERRES